MVDRKRRSAGQLAALLVAGLMTSDRPVEAHGGGHGGHAAASGHHSGGTGSGHPPRLHGAGGSTGRNAASTIDGPLTFNPYDLPAARMHRFFQHLFHQDGQAHP